MMMTMGLRPKDLKRADVFRGCVIVGMSVLNSRVFGSSRALTLFAFAVNVSGVLTTLKSDSEVSGYERRGLPR
jgi:hypothetical protein